MLLLGSLLIFIGIASLSFNYFLKIKDMIYSDMRIAMMDKASTDETIYENVPVTQNVSNENNNTNEYYEVDYSKYLGVLEIPKIGLK